MPPYWCHLKVALPRKLDTKIFAISFGLFSGFAAKSDINLISSNLFLIQIPPDGNCLSQIWSNATKSVAKIGQPPNRVFEIEPILSNLFNTDSAR